MDRVRIYNSSNILEVGYDPAAEVLEIMFSDGRLYHYFDVPPHIAKGLINPPGGSPGAFFHAKIHQVYPVVRL